MSGASGHGTIPMLDPFWSRLTAGCPPALRPWLRDQGSLTQRIQQRCAKFEVQPLHSGLARLAYDEAALLGIAPHRLAWSREVFLYADGVPVVFAHSACARAHLRGAWKAMDGLGNRSLGSLLFSHPLVVRQPLHFKALRAPHPLVSRILAQPHRIGLPPLPPYTVLWARRSLFTLHGAPLLVTEVFLPGILDLR
ncbi:MAG: chorismate lyase [Sideroxydans sp.]